MLELAREADWEDVNRLARQVTAYHAQWDANIQAVEYPYPMDYFLTCTKPESIHDSVIYVERRDGAVVGYMRFYLWQTNSAVTEKRAMLSIDDFGVEETLRHHGIGTDMMNQLRDFATQLGCKSLCLYVDAPNENAIAFYEKCGFLARNIGMRLPL